MRSTNPADPSAAPPPPLTRRCRSGHGFVRDQPKVEAVELKGFVHQRDHLEDQLVLSQIVTLLEDDLRDGGGG
jgi:hypothetical protein